MKKSVKIISAILIVMMVVATLGSIVLASDPSSVISSITDGSHSADTTKLQNLGGTVVSIIQVVGIIVAVVVIMVIGIKYMMGSAEEKAEYKKVMIPYVIGAVLIFAASTIVNVVYQISQGLSGSVNGTPATK